MSAALQQALLTLKPQSVQDFGNGAQSGEAVLAGINTKCCTLRVRPWNSTSTPRRSDGFFLSYIFGAICESFSFLFEQSGNCHFVQESFGIIFAEGAYALGDLVLFVQNNI